MHFKIHGFRYNIPGINNGNIIRLTMEDIDRDILKYLQRPATLSVADLADRVGISKSSCWRRVRKLKRDGIIKDRINLLEANGLGGSPFL